MEIVEALRQMNHPIVSQAAKSLRLKVKLRLLQGHDRCSKVTYPSFHTTSVSCETESRGGKDAWTVLVERLTVNQSQFGQVLLREKFKQSDQEFWDTDEQTHHSEGLCGFTTAGFLGKLLDKQVDGWNGHIEGEDFEDEMLHA